MHTVELLEEALAAARKLGVVVRHEWLGGSGGGACVLKGKPVAFVDLAVPPADQLDQVLEALRDHPGIATLSLSNALQSLVIRRRAA